MTSHGSHRAAGRLSLAVLLACVLGWLASFAHGQTAERNWPDIREPGLDLGDFPNSAFTIPAGTWQVEVAPFTYVSEDRSSRPQYFTQFLLRYGLTDDVEFRLLGNGLTVEFTEPETVGFSPLVLDGKVHLWDERPELLLPASSLEVLLTTDWGSPAFASRYQPTINLNFDYSLTETLGLEWTVGYGEILGTTFIRTPRRTLALNENVNQVSFQWSIAKEVTDDIEVFVTGLASRTVPKQSSDVALAFGSKWNWSDRLSYFALIGWGVTPDTPKFGGQIGLGVALGRPRAKPVATEFD